MKDQRSNEYIIDVFEYSEFLYFLEYIRKQNWDYLNEKIESL